MCLKIKSLKVNDSSIFEANTEIYYITTLKRNFMLMCLEPAETGNEVKMKRML